LAGETESKTQLDLLPMALVAAGDQAEAALRRTQRFGRRGKRFGCSPGARQNGRRELSRPGGDTMDADSDGRSRRAWGNGSGMRGSTGRTLDTPGNLPGAPRTDGEDWDVATEEIERRRPGGCSGRSGERKRGRGRRKE
jgi:hypothetical protein